MAYHFVYLIFYLHLMSVDAYLTNKYTKNYGSNYLRLYLSYFSEQQLPLSMLDYQLVSA
jgi:hypothetical protein